MSIKAEVFLLEQWLQGFLTKSFQGAIPDNAMRSFVLGLSGGIDSAVIAALAKRAVDNVNARDVAEELRRANPDAQTIAMRSMFAYTEQKILPPARLNILIMPIDSSPKDAEDAYAVVDAFGLRDTTTLVDLTDTYNTLLKASGTPSNLGKVTGNLKARLRMSALYLKANITNGRVLGTDNAAETYTGYFTKHGDGAADLFPLSDFSKREVYELGRALGVPQQVLDRAPSAGLWHGQTDEDEMGLTYDFIDNFLEGVPEANAGPQEYPNSERLKYLHEISEHKRAPAPKYNRAFQRVIKK